MGEAGIEWREPMQGAQNLFERESKQNGIRFHSDNMGAG